jgi:translation initiation factor IF-3
VSTFFVEVSGILNKEKDSFVNEQIRASEVMVIGPNGEQLGIKGIKDALTLANYAGFDLVMISPNATPPVCKIMDYNKHKYESSKRQKENMKRQREANLEMKEYRFSVTIDIHDFNTRVKNAMEYLVKGHKIKASLKFRGREMIHPELGKEVLIRYADALKEVSVIEKYPAMDGKFMNMILMPNKDK